MHCTNRHIGICLLRLIDCFATPLTKGIGTVVYCRTWSACLSLPSPFFAWSHLNQFRPVRRERIWEELLQFEIAVRNVLASGVQLNPSLLSCISAGLCKSNKSKMTTGITGRDSGPLSSDQSPWTLESRTSKYEFSFAVLYRSQVSREEKLRKYQENSLSGDPTLIPITCLIAELWTLPGEIGF